MKIGFLELVGTHADFPVFAEALEAKQSGIESHDAHRVITILAFLQIVDELSSPPPQAFKSRR